MLHDVALADVFSSRSFPSPSSFHVMGFDTFSPLDWIAGSNNNGSTEALLTALKLRDAKLQRAQDIVAKFLEVREFTTFSGFCLI